MAKQRAITHSTALGPKTKGRPGILPPLGVDFDTALGALLRTPPPLKGEATNRPKRKAAKKR